MGRHGVGPRAPILALRALAIVMCFALAPVSSAAAASPSLRATQTGSTNPRVNVLETTPDLARRLTRVPDMSLRVGVPTRGRVIRVDDSVRYQRVVGVGGAMTDSAAWLIHTQLSHAAGAALMAKLFGTHGIHLSFIRVPMGASDFTVRGKPYTYDDLLSGRTDPLLVHFSVAHDYAYILPTLRDALRLNPSAELLATPWSAPAWMKANRALDNRHFAGSLLPQARGAFANYFVKFIRAYARRGVKISGVTPQNEPEAPTQYPGMNVSASDEAGWILDYLRPALRSAGLSTGVYGADTGFSNTSYPMLIASRASKALAGIAEHCYHETPTVFDPLHLMDPALDLVVSECALELTPWAAPEIAIASMRHWASSVALWNLALDPSGGPVQPPDSGCRPCGGLVVINERKHSVAYSLAYYQLGQIGRWLQPGAWRIASGNFVSYFHRPGGAFGATTGLDDVAFLDPDGTRVLVVYNNATRSTRFTVQWGARSLTYRLPPHGTASFKWRPSG